MSKKLARKLLAVARSILARDDDWEKGYDAGVVAANIVEWNIADVVSVAALIGKKSGVPELVRLVPAIERSEDSDWESETPQPEIARLAAKTLQKAKRYGPMGIAGAMAGVLEDANAHRAAKYLYDVRDKLVTASQRLAALPALRPLTDEEEMTNWIRDRVQAAGPRGIATARLVGVAKKFGYDRRAILKAVKGLENDEYLTTAGGKVVWTFAPPWER